MKNARVSREERRKQTSLEERLKRWKDTEAEAKRFGWWWRDLVKALAEKALAGKLSCEFLLGKALLEKFPREFQGVDYLLPELEQAAFDYELASRADSNRPRYLLGRRFEKLSYRDMFRVMDTWQHYQPKRAPLIAYRRGELPLELEEDPALEEGEFAAKTGSTLPFYLKLNLREYGDKAISEEFVKVVQEKRERLGITAPKNAGRRSRAKSFHEVEALDVWRNLSPEERPAKHDMAEARRAVPKAKTLREEWARSARNGAKR